MILFLLSLVSLLALLLALAWLSTWTARREAKYTWEVAVSRGKLAEEARLQHRLALAETLRITKECNAATADMYAARDETAKLREALDAQHEVAEHLKTECEHCHDLLVAEQVYGLALLLNRDSLRSSLVSIWCVLKTLPIESMACTVRAADQAADSEGGEP